MLQSFSPERTWVWGRQTHAAAARATTAMRASARTAKLIVPATAAVKAAKNRVAPVAVGCP